jgi:DNA-binding NarL/FixJ family response regulator
LHSTDRNGNHVVSNSSKEVLRAMKAGRTSTKAGKNCVQLVAEGQTNRDISRELGLSEHTVRNYLFRIFNKLGTSNWLELALYALNHQLTGRDDNVE